MNREIHFARDTGMQSNCVCVGKIHRAKLNRLRFPPRAFFMKASTAPGAASPVLPKCQCGNTFQP
jgi:hypothetical protein